LARIKKRDLKSLMQ